MTHLPQPVRRRGRLVRAAVVAACALGVAVASAGSAGAATRRETPNQRADRQVSANLWEWNWPSVGQGMHAPCSARPATAPSRSRRRRTRSTTAPRRRRDRSCTRGGRSISRRLQLTSRMGTEAQFQAMVAHLPQGRREGVRRRGHQPHDRPGRHLLRRRNVRSVQLPGPVHAGELPQHPGDCPRPSGGIDDFNNQLQVFDCELVGPGGPAHRVRLGAHDARRLPQQAARLRRLRLPGRRRQAHRPGRPGRDLRPAAPTRRRHPALLGARGLRRRPRHAVARRRSRAAATCSVSTASSSSRRVQELPGRRDRQHRDAAGLR